MEAVEFLEELTRMCDIEGCNGTRCIAFISKEKIIEKVKEVEQWAKEHPRKTYKQDFLEKFPNAKNSIDAGILSSYCRNTLYGIEGRCLGHSCGECWNEEMEE